MAAGKIRVLAPNREFRGEVAGIMFEDGAASFDRAAHEGAFQYFQSAGYTVGGDVANPLPEREVAAPAPGTPTNPDGIIRGLPANDAAVMKDAGGPVSDAFLPPTNAGEADPHGPLVVSPGLHAVPPAPIRPGEVFVDDVARQEAAETDLARKVLVEGQPATIIASDEGPGGPLGLSDPGSIDAGIRGAEGIPSADDLRAKATAAATAPTKSAKVAEWRDFAVARGMTPEEAADLTKEELVGRYGA